MVIRRTNLAGFDVEQTASATHSARICLCRPPYVARAERLIRAGGGRCQIAPVSYRKVCALALRTTHLQYARDKELCYRPERPGARVVLVRSDNRVAGSRTLARTDDFCRNCDQGVGPICSIVRI